MMTHVISSMQRESAKYIRDLEYIREMASTDVIDDSFSHALSQMEDDIENEELSAMEAKEILDMMDDDDSFVEEEVTRIMENTSESMTLDDVMGIITE